MMIILGVLGAFLVAVFAEAIFRNDWQKRGSSRVVVPVVIGLLICPPSFSAPKQPAEAPAVSSAVVRGATEAAQNLLTKMKAGSHTDADVRGAVTALGILFAHLEETGYNAWLQQRITANPEAVLNLENHSEISTSQRQQFLREVRVFGMLEIEAQIVRRVQELSQGESEQTRAGVGIGKFLPVVCYLAADSATAALLAVLSPPPLDAILGAVSAVYALLAAWKC
jgi:hypothetical protein